MGDSVTAGLGKLDGRQRAFVNLLKGWMPKEEYADFMQAVEKLGTDDHAAAKVGTDDHAAAKVGVGTDDHSVEKVGTDDHAAAKVGTDDHAAAKPKSLAEETFDRQRRIREHDVLTRKLDKTFAKINDFKNLDAGEQKEYTNASKAVPRPPTGSDKKQQDEYYKLLSANASELAKLRDDYKNKGNALIKSYASAKGGNQSDDDPYWEVKAEEYIEKNGDDVRAVNKLGPQNAKMEKQQKDWKAEGDKLWEDLQAKKITKKAYYEAIEKHVAKCAGIRELGKNRPDGEPEFFSEFKKAQAKVNAAAAKDGKLKELWDAVQADSEKTDTNFAGLLKRLEGINKTAEEVLGAQVEGLRKSIKSIAEPGLLGYPAFMKTNKTRDLIDDTDPLILARLDQKEQRQAFDLLCAYGVPPADEKHSDYKDRRALHKLMCATSIHPEFLCKDNKTSEEMIKSLEENKEEFKVAKENWSILEPDQKLEIVRKLAAAQAKAFKFQMPKRGVQLVKMEKGYQGLYKPGPVGVEPPDDVVEINPDGERLEDFEATCDMIFHEMTHKYQNTLTRRLNTDTSDGKQITEKDDVLYNQAMMFQTAEKTESGRSTTITPEEKNLEAYQKQPKEAHAWTAGPLSMRQFLKMLSK
jgi:hypothetical protein